MEIQLWRSILCPYELAVKELTVKFKHMIEEYHENDRYSPIEQVSGRVKSVSSILEKMQRKDIPIEQLETEETQETVVEDQMGQTRSGYRRILSRKSIIWWRRMGCF